MVEDVFGGGRLNDPDDILLRDRELENDFDEEDEDFDADDYGDGNDSDF